MSSGGASIRSGLAPSWVKVPIQPERRPTVARSIDLFKTAALVFGLCGGAAACQKPQPVATAELVQGGPGPVDAVVRAELARARQDHRSLVVYVSAEWCKPCQEFKAALKSHALDAYFPGLRLLEFDADRSSEGLESAGYGGTYLPRFVLPTAAGRGGEKIEGARKDVGAVDFIGPRLQRLAGLARS